MCAQAVVGVMSAFKEIETCMECSAKHLDFVAEVFYYAVKAVVHPTAALFDAMTQTLKPRCVNALKRIFMLCDRNQVRPPRAFPASRSQVGVGLAQSRVLSIPETSGI